jgi:hypothetical protein
MTLPAYFLARLSTTGDIMRQGPQVGEKKSTMTGLVAWLIKTVKLESSNSTGTAAWSMLIGVPQLPHFGPRCCLSAGILFFVLQFWQIAMVLFICNP